MVVTADAFTSVSTESPGRDVGNGPFQKGKQQSGRLTPSQLWHSSPTTTDEESSIDNEVQQQHLVLVGGGHAHAQVLKALRARPKHLKVTAIDPQAAATYSGMVPGCIAGLYTPEQTQIDVEALSQWAGLDFICDSVVDIDFEKKLVYTKGGDKAIEYDAISLDIGSTSRQADSLPGVRQYSIATRPISSLVKRLRAEIAGATDLHSDPRVVIVGGGIAGIELAMSVQSQFINVAGRAPHTTLLNAGSMLLPDETERVRDALHAILKEKDITIHHRVMVKRVEEDCVVLDEDHKNIIPFDYCIWSTGAAAHPLAWHLQEKRGLDGTEHGWIKVDQNLQSTSHEGVFAAGDCAHIVRSDGQKSPPKAGVYAVRAGPVLVQNLTRYLEALRMNKKAQLQEYHPQDDFMKLLVCGSRRAFGIRFGLPLYGHWVLKMKDAIDRGFMQLFENLSDNEPIHIGEYDTSQYDTNDPLADVELPTPEAAAQLIQSSDDDCDWKQAWFVMRKMTQNNDYRAKVLKCIELCDSQFGSFR
jgi:selenide,water dikinase